MAFIFTVMEEELTFSSSSEKDACLRRGRVTKLELGQQLFSSRGAPENSLHRIEPQLGSPQAANDLRCAHVQAVRNSPDDYPIANNVVCWHPNCVKVVRPYELGIRGDESMPQIVRPRNVQHDALSLIPVQDFCPHIMDGRR